MKGFYIKAFLSNVSLIADIERIADDIYRDVVFFLRQIFDHDERWKLSKISRKNTSQYIAIQIYSISMFNGEKKDSYNSLSFNILYAYAF